MAKKFIRLLLTEKQAEVLNGHAIINTLLSILEDSDDFVYDKRAVKQLIAKLEKI